jgi:NADH-quinone oxidoreductase subunit C
MVERCFRMGIANNLHREVSYLMETFKSGIELFVIDENILYVDINKNNLYTFLIYLKYNNLLKYEQLLDIWAVDTVRKVNRFQVNYLLLSVRYNKRIIVRVSLDDSVALDSIVSIFSSSGWLEREVWDMFGIVFINNSDLRRILTDYGFDGYPLRKDFPLTGYLECRYDDSDGRITLEPIEMSQEYRVFNFNSPW